jgi:uncharacterized protein YndB with AHSA1/START domain
VSARVLVSVRVAASPERAFAVFVHDIGAWWHPNDLFGFTPGAPGSLAFEARAGGRLTETRADGAVFEIGRITAWEPGARLAFTWRQASFAPGQLTRVEVRFERAGAETRVTVEHQGWDSVPAGHVARHGFPDPVFLRRHGEWWQRLLGSFAAAVTAA